jgi:hypothetical protein
VVTLLANPIDFQPKNRATKEAIFRDKVASFLLPEKKFAPKFYS